MELQNGKVDINFNILHTLIRISECNVCGIGLCHEYCYHRNINNAVLFTSFHYLSFDCLLFIFSSS